MPAWLQDVILTLSSLDASTVYGVGFVVLLLCGLGLPIPEDITLLLMGYLTYLPMPDGGPRPHANIVFAVAVGLLGVIMGDGFMFWLGRRFGEKLLAFWPFRWALKGQRLVIAREFLESQGPKVLFSARFMPGLRSVVFFTSGMLHTPFARFVLFDGVAALISVPALVVAAWFWGPEFDMVIDRARSAEHGILMLIVAIGAVLGFKAWWSARKKRREAAARAAQQGDHALADHEPPNRGDFDVPAPR